jgi:hypothetical protein
MFVDAASEALFEGGVGPAYGVYDGQTLTKCDRKGVIESAAVQLSTADLVARGFPQPLATVPEDEDCEDALEVDDPGYRLELEPLSKWWGVSVKELSWDLDD